MQNLSELFLLFTIYSFIGWMCESIYCSVIAEKLINRGFLNGPFCPIYGVGALLVIKLLAPFAGNPAVLYLASVVVTSILEYVTGFLLEKLFHTKWWDYSHRRFNLQGRVCLGNALLFGVMGVIVTHRVHPSILHLLAQIPADWLLALTIALGIYFLCDTAITVRTILQLNGRLAELQRVLDEIREKGGTVLDEKRRTVLETKARLEEGTKARLEALRSRQKALEQESRLLHRRLINAFPTMKSIRHSESLAHMQQALRERMQNRKN
ncbi:putative ABC transporter permease [Anaeromassilibacillus senegalensis]|uniref:putative ABC transporter permease n=1 Tax=Anaeromassilibacillus senegalensis TaxID=1673717 RepID=UPI000681BEC9|nr:putative ABC transporter permease [Anaeromassilibacillus senegalensis]